MPKDIIMVTGPTLIASCGEKHGRNSSRRASGRWTLMAAIVALAVGTAATARDFLSPFKHSTTHRITAKKHAMTVHHSSKGSTQAESAETADLNRKSLEQSSAGGCMSGPAAPSIENPDEPVKPQKP